MFGEPVVKRQIQTTPTVSQPTYDDYGVGYYYYYDFRFAILLIVLGVIVGLIEFAAVTGLIMIPFISKKYICLKCKHTFKSCKKPKRCPKCGSSSVLTEKEYLENKETLNLYNKNNTY